MNDMKQPEAIALADWFDQLIYPTSFQVRSSAELRRLHAENEALRKAVTKLHAAKGRYHTQLAACDLYDMLGLKNERPTK